MKTHGIYEWAKTSVNCTAGCRNDCRYCYARTYAVLRKEIKTLRQWSQPKPRKRDLAKEMKKHKGTVMFPSSHDIFLENLDDCLEVLENLLKAGNKVLITSKPREKCISKIRTKFHSYKENILFRFTIGCSDNEILKIWEPGAPFFERRLRALKNSYEMGFNTSVSMEPMLDPENIVQDTSLILPFVSDFLWIGKMNKIKKRAWGVPTSYIEKVRMAQTDEYIHQIYQQMKDHPKIKWKESIKMVVGLPLPDKPGMDI